jgi:hypothetical protein
MSLYQSDSPHWSAIVQHARVVRLHTGIVLLGIFLISFGCPLACLVQCWMNANQAFSASLFNQTPAVLHYHATNAPWSRDFGAITQAPAKNNTDCAVCRTQEAPSLFTEAALLTPALIAFLLIPSTPLPVSALFLRSVPHSPPRQPPRFLTT